MKILVTGATGFIGSHLVVKLRLLGHDVITLSRRPILVNKRDRRVEQRHYAIDLGETDQSRYTYFNFENLCKEHKPEVIFHLASNPLVKIDEENPHQIILDNMVSTQKVAHYAPEGCKVVLASSVIVYGDWLFNSDRSPDNLIYKEKHNTRPTSVYGMTKRASESILETYANMGRIKAASARLCATVGGGLTHGVVKDFIRKLRSENPYLEVLGSYPGSNKPFCHIEDLLEALVLLAGSDLEQYEEYNVVPDDSINIEQVAEAVMDGLQIQKPLKWLGEESTWKGDNKIIKVDNSKLKSIGWKPKFPNSKDVITDIVSKEK
tara:strand:- start:1268 stop:2230 length:963 start_codon:yes stop_codon:yes gene_type:complete